MMYLMLYRRLDIHNSSITTFSKSEESGNTKVVENRIMNNFGYHSDFDIFCEYHILHRFKQCLIDSIFMYFAFVIALAVACFCYYISCGDAFAAATPCRFACA